MTSAAFSRTSSFCTRGGCPPPCVRPLKGTNNQLHRVSTASGAFPQLPSSVRTAQATMLGFSLLTATSRTSSGNEPRFGDGRIVWGGPVLGGGGPLTSFTSVWSIWFLLWHPRTTANALSRQTPSSRINDSHPPAGKRSKVVHTSPKHNSSSGAAALTSCPLRPWPATSRHKGPIISTRYAGFALIQVQHERHLAVLRVIHRRIETPSRSHLGFSCSMCFVQRKRIGMCNNLAKRCCS